MIEPGGLPAQKRAFQIDPHHPVKIFFGNIQEIVAMDNSGIVDQNIDSVEAVQRGGHQIAHRKPVSHITMDKLHITQFRHGLFGGIASLFIIIRDDHTCALFQKAAGTGAPNAFGAPGYDGCLVFQDHEKSNICTAKRDHAVFRI